MTTINTEHASRLAADLRQGLIRAAGPALAEAGAALLRFGEGLAPAAEAARQHLARVVPAIEYPEDDRG